MYSLYIDAVYNTGLGMYVSEAVRVSFFPAQQLIHVVVPFEQDKVRVCDNLLVPEYSSRVEVERVLELHVAQIHLLA